MIVGVAASESEFKVHSLFRVVIWLLFDSDPHNTDMDRVESEPEFVHYSSNSFYPLVGFSCLHQCPIL